VKPTQQQLAKLPKWAQEHIRVIERERETAVEALNKYIDSQTESPFYTDDVICTGEGIGPSFKRRYFQGYKLTAEHAGVRLRIHLAGEHDGQREYGIELSWEAMDKGTRIVCMAPTARQQVQLISKENLR
jgi:hypothetical protein